MSCLLYTLAPTSSGVEWAVELGMRTTMNGRNRDRTMLRSMFDRREQACRWLLAYVDLFCAPGVPGHITETKVLLPLGGELPG